MFVGRFNMFLERLTYFHTRRALYSPSVSSPLPNQTTRPCSRPMQISLRIIRWKQRTSVPTGSSMEVIVGLPIIHTGKLENWKTGKLECCGKWDLRPSYRSLTLPGARATDGEGKRQNVLSIQCSVSRWTYHDPVHQPGRDTMNWEAIGAIGQILGSGGIFASALRSLPEAF